MKSTFADIPARDILAADLELWYIPVGSDLREESCSSDKNSRREEHVEAKPEDKGDDRSTLRCLSSFLATRWCIVPTMFAGYQDVADSAHCAIAGTVLRYIMS